MKLLSNQNLVNKCRFDGLGLLAIEVLIKKNNSYEEIECFLKRFAIIF